MKEMREQETGKLKHREEFFNIYVIGSL